MPLFAQGPLPRGVESTLLEQTYRNRLLEVDYSYIFND